MTKRLVAVCFVVLAVSACDSTTTQTVNNSGGAAGLQLVRMEDGTKCAVLVGAFKGGISCNWKQGE